MTQIIIQKMRATTILRTLALIATGVWLADPYMTTYDTTTTNALSGTTDCPKMRDYSFKDNACSSNSNKWPYILVTFSRSTAVKSIILAVDPTDNTLTYSGNIYVTDTPLASTTSPAPTGTKCAGPVDMDGDYDCATVLHGKYVLFVRETTEIKNQVIGFREFRIYSYPRTSLTIKIPDPTASYYDSSAALNMLVSNVLQSPIQSRLTFKFDPWAYVSGSGQTQPTSIPALAPLYGMLDAVIAKGWKGFTSNKNEAYILFDLGQPKHIKVVAVIGTPGGPYDKALMSHFIGIYDQAADLPLVSTPTAYLAGAGNNNMYNKGYDHPINARGRYVALWNSYAANYIACAYLAVFASLNDCNDNSGWIFTTQSPAAVTVPYQATSYSINLFPNIPAECADYIQSVNIATLPVWMAYSHPTLTVTPQTAFSVTELTITLNFYQEGFISTPKTVPLKVVNNGDNFYISQLPDVTYLIGSGNEIAQFTWNSGDYPTVMITTDKPTILTSGSSGYWAVSSNSVGSWKVTYAGTAISSTSPSITASLSFQLTIVCGTKMSCISGFLGRPYFFKVGASSVTSNCAATGTPCTGQNMVPAVSCPSLPSSSSLITQQSPSAGVYTMVLNTLTIADVGIFTCQFTYTDNGVAQPSWTEQKLFKVYCLPTALVLDPSFLATSTTISYRLKSQDFTVDGSAATAMLATGYLGDFPSFIQDPSQCDPAQNFVYTTQITVNAITTTHTGTFTSSVISIDFSSFRFTVNKTTDCSLAGLYTVVISATAKDSTDANALTISSTASYTINLTLCGQILNLGTNLPARPATYTMSYPPGTTQTFPAHFMFLGNACSPAITETTYSISYSQSPAIPAITFISVAAVSPYTVTIDSSLYQGLSGTYSITLIATASTDTTITNSEFIFDVTLNCSITATAAAIPDVTIDLSQVTSQVVTIPAITLTPAYCQPALTSLTVNQSYTFMTLVLAGSALTITPANQTNLGTHTVTISANVSIPASAPSSPITQLIADVFSFHVILSSCLVTITPPAQVQSFDYNIIGSPSQPQEYPVPDYTITGTGTGCSTGYTLSATNINGQTLQSFLSLSVSTTPTTKYSIFVNTDQVQHMGVHQIRLSATYSGTPLVHDETVIVTITVYCQITNITPSLGVVNGATVRHVLNPLSGGNQPTKLSIGFDITPALCNASFTIALSQSKPFYSYNSVTKTFEINTQSVQDQGEYPVTITATADASAGTFIRQGSLESQISITAVIICRIETFTPTSTMPTNVIHNEKGLPYVPTTFSFPTYSFQPNCQANLISSMWQEIGGVFSSPTLPITKPSPPRFVLNTQDPVFVGKYKLQLEVTIEASTTLDVPSAITDKQSFNLEIISYMACNNLELKSVIPQARLYQINSAPLVLPFPEYTFVPDGCDPTMTYEMKLISKIPDLGFQFNGSFNTTMQFGVMPSFVSKTWNEKDGFTIQGTNLLESWNLYSFLVIAKEGISGKLNNKYVFQVQTEIDCRSASFILPPIPSSISYELGEPAFVSTFDEVTDSLSKSTDIQFICGPIITELLAVNDKNEEVDKFPEPIKYNPTKREISVESTLESDVGTYTLNLAIYFYKNKENQIRKPINVTIKPRQAIQTKTKVIAAANSTATNKNETQVATVPQYEVQNQTTDLEALLAQTLPERPPVFKGQKLKMRFANVRITDVSGNGVVTLQMDEQVVLINEGQFINPDMLWLEYIKTSEEPVVMTGFDLIKYQKTEIQLKVNFTDNILVSAGFTKDLIRVNLSKYLFVPVYEPYRVEKEEQRNLQADVLIFVLEAVLPNQMKSESQFKKIEAFSQTINKSMTATLAIPFLAQVVAKSAMKKLWAYFNTMQLVISFNEYEQVQAPANVMTLQKGYKDILQVKLIPDVVIHKAMLKFGLEIGSKDNSTDSISLPSQERRMLLFSKVRPRNFMIYWGILLSFVGAIIALLIFVIWKRKAIWAKLSQSTKKKILSFKDSLIWSAPIRTIIEIYYPTLLAALLSFFNGKAHGTGLISPIVQILLLISFTGFTFYYTRKHQEEIPDAAFRQKTAAYWTNVETFKNPRASFYSFVFLLRRTLLAFIIFGFQFNCVLQILLTVHLSLLMISWILIVKPLDSGLKNGIEVMNECILLFHSYFSFVFTMYVPDARVKYQFGFIYISILGVGLTFNLSIQVQNIISEFRRLRRLRQAKLQVQIKEPVKDEAVDEDKDNNQQSSVESSIEHNKADISLKAEERRNQLMEKFKAELMRIEQRRRRKDLMKKVEADLNRLDEERLQRQNRESQLIMEKEVKQAPLVRKVLRQDSFFSNMVYEVEIKQARDSFFSDMVYDLNSSDQLDSQQPVRHLLNSSEQVSESKNSERQVYRPSRVLLGPSQPSEYEDQEEGLRYEDVAFNYDDYIIAEDKEVKQPNAHSRPAKRIEKIVTEKPRQPQLLETSTSGLYDFCLQPTQIEKSFAAQDFPDIQKRQSYKPSAPRQRRQQIISSSQESSDEMDNYLKVEYKRKRYTPKVIKEFNYEQNLKGPNNLSAIASPKQKSPKRRN